MLGRTPKVTTSASESNSFPIGEVTLRILAANPSKKSKIQAININREAFCRLVWKTSVIPKQPQSKLQQVKKLGMCFLMFIIFLSY